MVVLKVFLVSETGFRVGEMTNVVLVRSEANLIKVAVFPVGAEEDMQNTLFGVWGEVMKEMQTFGANSDDIELQIQSGFENAVAFF